jgi:hypothetical protein
MNYPGMTQENKQLIERYLDNSLTGFELKEFLDKLESDKNFREQVSFHNLLIEGIQEAEDKHLVTLLEQRIGYHRPLVPTDVKLILTFLIITAGGIAVWNYTGPDSSEKRHNYFSFDFLKSKKESSQNLPNEKIPASTKKTAQKKYLNPLGNIPAKENPKSPDTAIEQKPVAEDIVVKQDQLLISVNLKSTLIEDQHTSENNSDVSNAQKTADKLNPDASLPDIENSSDNNYTVEFWVSPVNYRGYKFIKDKLILFGIEEPDAIQLFSKGEKLWMKYGKSFYYLEKTDNFESFVATNEIPSALK